MKGLTSNFGLSLTLSLAVAAATALLAFINGRRAVMAGRPWAPAAAQVLAVGAILVTLVATALPQRWGLETDGDLVLALGRGGLRNWRILFEDTTSLASIQLVANVALYTAVGFTMTVGWHAQRWLALPACAALSLLIETVQYLALGRVAALDDVLLNVTGGLIGYLVAVAALRWRPAITIA